MTDKHIIDVTKCIHFNKSDIPNGCACYWDGECNHDCYYKQLLRKEQECEELKREKKNFHNFLTNKYNYGSFRPMWGAYLLRRFFKEDLGDFFDEAAYEMANTIEEKEKQIDKYSQALAEIKDIAEEYEELHGFLDCSGDLILQKISEVKDDR